MAGQTQPRQQAGGASSGNVVGESRAPVMPPVQVPCPALQARSHVQRPMPRTWQRARSSAASFISAKWNATGQRANRGGGDQQPITSCERQQTRVAQGCSLCPLTSTPCLDPSSPCVAPPPRTRPPLPPPPAPSLACYSGVRQPAVAEVCRQVLQVAGLALRQPCLPEGRHRRRQNGRRAEPLCAGAGCQHAAIDDGCRGGGQLLCTGREDWRTASVSGQQNRETRPPKQSERRRNAACTAEDLMCKPGILLPWTGSQNWSRPCPAGALVDPAAGSAVPTLQAVPGERCCSCAAGTLLPGATPKRCCLTCRPKAIQLCASKESQTPGVQQNAPPEGRSLGSAVARKSQAVCRLSRVNLASRRGRRSMTSAASAPVPNSSPGMPMSCGALRFFRGGGGGEASPLALLPAATSVAACGVAGSAGASAPVLVGSSAAP